MSCRRGPITSSRESKPRISLHSTLAHLVLVAACAFSGTTSARADANGSWSGIGPPEGRYSAAAVFDPIRDRMLICGGIGVGTEGFVNLNDTWAWSRTPTPAWTHLNAVNPAQPIGTTSINKVVYDAVQDRLVAAGGGAAGVWTLALAGTSYWTPLAVAGTPPASIGFTCFDTSRDRMIVSNGSSGVWELSLGGTPTWTQLAPTGTAPSSPSGYYDGAYDGAHDRCVFTAGTAAAWQLSFAANPSTPAWSQLTVSGSPEAATNGFRCAFDDAGQRLMRYSGYGPSDYTTQVWALSLSGPPTWNLVPATGGGPLARFSPAAAYDPVRRELLSYGGLGDAYLPFYGIWTLSLSGASVWTERSGDASPPLASLCGYGVYDPNRDRWIVGGTENPSTGYHFAWDVKALDLQGGAGWRNPSLGLRYDHTAPLFDPRLDALYSFGGSDAGVAMYCDAGAVSFSGLPLGPVFGTEPPRTYSRSADRDSRRNRALLFGGDFGFPGNDLYELTLAPARTWTHLSPGGTLPPLRRYHASIYDPVRDRLIVFAGDNGSSYLNDLWALDLADPPMWAPLVTTGSAPPLGVYYRAVYDPIRDRMLVFSSSGATWALALTGSPAWTALSPGGTPPAPANELTPAAYDPIRDALLVQWPEAGAYPALAVSRASELTFAEPAAPRAVLGAGDATWSAGIALTQAATFTNTLGGPRAIGWRLEVDRAWPGMPIFGTAVVGDGATLDVPFSLPVPDSALSGRVRMRLTCWYEGGYGNNRVLDRYLGDGVTGVAPGSPEHLALVIEAPHPNPARDLNVAFVLADSRVGTLDVFDVSGRRVTHLTIAGRYPGRQQIAIGGAGLPAGVYLVRLSQGAHSVSTRAAILK